MACFLCGNEYEVGIEHGPYLCFDQIETLEKKGTK
jgi:hypothetical protein